MLSHHVYIWFLYSDWGHEHWMVRWLLMDWVLWDAQEYDYIHCCTIIQLIPTRMFGSLPSMPNHTWLKHCKTFVNLCHKMKTSLIEPWISIECTRLQRVANTYGLSSCNYVIQTSTRRLTINTWGCTCMVTLQKRFSLQTAGHSQSDQI